MLAPVLLALGASGTLALRTTSRPTRRVLLSLLHIAPVRVATHPVGAALGDGAFLGLYFTPLYDLSVQHPVLHALVHVHVFLSGCALAWAFVGQDPVGRRVSQRGRLLLLLLVLAVHGSGAKLLYAGYGAATADPPTSRTVATARTS